MIRIDIARNTEELARYFRFGDVTSNGIIFDWELAGPGGADFYLFPAPWHTQEDIEDAEREIRGERDALGVYIGKVEGEYPIPQEPPTWTPEQREEGFRKIVRERAFAQVEDCVLVDLFTANYMVQVLDALSPENKAKMLSFRASKMVDLMWKLVEKTGA